MVAVSWSGNAGGLKAGDLPDPGGEPLVDAGVTKGSIDRYAIVGPLNLGTRGDDGDGANQFDLALDEIETGQGDLVGAHPVKLLGFRADLAGDGNADVVVREEFIHGGNVAAELSQPPLLLKRLNLLSGGVFFFVEGLVIAPAGAKCRRSNPYRNG